jgi:hypothetical protein
LLNETRSTLLALLLDMPLGPPQEVEGLADLSGEDKLFLLTTCCSEMIAEAVWCTSGGNRELAIEGVDGLMRDIKNNIAERRID